MSQARCVTTDTMPTLPERGGGVPSSMQMLCFGHMFRAFRKVGEKNQYDANARVRIITLFSFLRTN